MNRNIVSYVFVLILFLLFGCKDEAVQLAPISGGWVYHSRHEQEWKYDFISDEKVYFAIDSTGRNWNITNININSNIIKIDIDEFLGQGPKQNSTIKVELLDNKTIMVSSGMHPGILFTREHGI